MLKINTAETNVTAIRRAEYTDMLKMITWKYTIHGVDFKAIVAEK